jgi:hypothetical protein
MQDTVDYKSEALRLVKAARDVISEAGHPGHRFAFPILSGTGRPRLGLVYENNEDTRRTGNIPIFDLPPHYDVMTLSCECNEAAGISPEDADEILRSSGFGNKGRHSLLPGLPGGRALQ